jgi:hypothetical protein
MVEAALLGSKTSTQNTSEASPQTDKRLSLKLGIKNEKCRMSAVVERMVDKERIPYKPSPQNANCGKNHLICVGFGCM